MTIADKILRAKEDYDRVFEAGKKSGGGNEAFWNSFQQNGQRTNYHMAFANSPLTSETFRPKYDMNCSNCYFMFAYIGQYYKDAMQITDLSAYLESVGVTLDTSQATEIRNMFYVSPTIVRVPEISAESCTSVEGVFFSCSKLTTIDKLILRSDGTNTFSGTFDWCGNLKEIRFEGVIGNNIAFASSPLSKESLTSLVNALSPSVSGKTLTLNANAVHNAFTDAEWSALKATRSNWSFNV